MSVRTLASIWLSQLFPFRGRFVDCNAQTLRADAEAGVTGAILALPQAIALATLAGMPPEYGIYASVFPVIIAALWGSSYHVLAGPNTALSVLIAASIAPLASPGTDDYIHFVLMLTFMAGIIQLAVGLARLGTLLDFISHTVVVALVTSVAMIIVVQAGATFLGVLSNLDEPFFVRAYQLAHDIARANPFAVAVGAVTLAAGFIAKRFWRRYALVIAVVSGSLFSYGLNLAFGPATTQIELLGRIDISPWPFQLPTVGMQTAHTLSGLIGSAFSVAALGLMLTVIMARAIAARSGQVIDTHQEVVGQGVANIIGPFFLSFAGSGSVNRSMAHYDAGARTPLAAIFTAVLLAALVLVAGDIIAYLPMPAVGGALILVGLGLVDWRELHQVLRPRREAGVFAATVLVTLFFGLNSGVAAGLLLSLVFYLLQSSAPSVRIKEFQRKDGREMLSVTIAGDLFFGSVHHVERLLESIRKRDRGRGVLVLKLDQVNYIDASGAMLLAAELRRRRSRGGDLFIVNQDTRKVSTLLDKLLDHHQFDRGHVIDLRHLSRTLRTNRHFAHLPKDQVLALLERSELRSVAAGGSVFADDEASQTLLLLNGTLEICHAWQERADQRGTHCWRLSAEGADSPPQVLFTANKSTAVKAVTNSQVMILNNDTIDEVAGWVQRFAAEPREKPQTRRRAGLIKDVSVLRQLPLDNVSLAIEQMVERTVNAGEVIVNEGEEGDAYYVIEEGEAEVWRTDARTHEPVCVAHLGLGDAFGEEALLQGGVRNATVRMVTPGRLLSLSREQFQSLVRPWMVQELDAEDVYRDMQKGRCKIIDCRYEFEYAESHIPGAVCVPLDHLRERMTEFDPRETYVVYCQTGRRSASAAFLMRERYIKAFSLRGGLYNWPYALTDEADEAKNASKKESNKESHQGASE